mmetsp:Transcript_39641/g.60696  ORF Transcript_39641/g.60696 Transcript_39641/m.60696 type:complete len:215 (-) Transcript_39641:1829-2473(-)
MLSELGGLDVVDVAHHLPDLATDVQLRLLHRRLLEVFVHLLVDALVTQAEPPLFHNVGAVWHRNESAGQALDDGPPELVLVEDQLLLVFDLGALVHVFLTLLLKLVDFRLLLGKACLFSDHTKPLELHVAAVNLLGQRVNIDLDQVPLGDLVLELLLSVDHLPHLVLVKLVRAGHVQVQLPVLLLLLPYHLQLLLVGRVVAQVFLEFYLGHPHE